MPTDWLRNAPARFLRKTPITPRFDSKSSAAMTTSGPCASTSNTTPSVNVTAITLTWVWLGTHNEFDNLFAQRKGFTARTPP
jgi:hypothetical protein